MIYIFEKTVRTIHEHQVEAPSEQEARELVKNGEGKVKLMWIINEDIERIEVIPREVEE